LKPFPSAIFGGTPRCGLYFFFTWFSLLSPLPFRAEDPVLPRPTENGVPPPASRRRPLSSSLGYRRLFSPFLLLPPLFTFTGCCFAARSRLIEIEGLLPSLVPPPPLYPDPDSLPKVVCLPLEKRQSLGYFFFQTA